jgi:hypothetical protein
MSLGRGLRWCRSCGHWTKHRRVARCLVCVPCARRFGDGRDTRSRPGVLEQAPSLLHDDARERAAGAEAEARRDELAEGPRPGLSKVAETGAPRRPRRPSAGRGVAILPGPAWEDRVPLDLFRVRDSPVGGGTGFWVSVVRCRYDERE